MGLARYGCPRYCFRCEQAWETAVTFRSCLARSRVSQITRRGDERGLVVVEVGPRTLPPLLPTIITDLSITAVQTQLTRSAAAACAAQLQFPGGRISDRLTRRTVLIASPLVLAAGSLILSSATTFVPFGDRQSGAGVRGVRHRATGQSGGVVGFLVALLASGAVLLGLHLTR